MDPVPDPILPETFLGYRRESNPGPLACQSDVLTTIPNRLSVIIIIIIIINLHMYETYFVRRQVKVVDIYKGHWDFWISDLVKNSDATDI